MAAELQALPAYTVEELVARAPTGPPLLVVLDGIEDPQNVGAILRSADARRSARRRSGRRGTRRRSTARRPRRRPARCSHVRIATVVNIARALEELKELNVWTVGLDGERRRRYDEVDYTLPTALVFGAEGTGLRRLVRETCDRLVVDPDGRGRCRA